MVKNKNFEKTILTNKLTYDKILDNVILLTSKFELKHLNTFNNIITKTDIKNQRINKNLFIKDFRFINLNSSIILNCGCRDKNDLSKSTYIIEYIDENNISIKSMQTQYIKKRHYMAGNGINKC